MKIVLITKQDKNNISNRLTEKFIKKLNKFHDITFNSVEAYNHKKQTLLITAKKIKREYNPDVVICHQHSQVLDKYFSSKHFNNCLKIMIAVDFWKVIKNNNLDWYYNNHFDLTVHRHYLPDIKKVNIPTVWLPFSADHNTFYPSKTSQANYVGFVGNCMSPQYFERRMAIHCLDGEGLLVYNRKKKGLNLKHYPEFLRLFKVGLCSAEFNSPFGKLFEIIASGSVPLVPDFAGRKELFWNNTLMFYKKDCSDIIHKAKRILNEQDLWKQYKENCYNNFLALHTDEQRIKEFYHIIKNAYKSRSIPRVWGL